MQEPEAAAAEAGEEEVPDQEEAAAAATREFLMDIVRAYVSRTAFEDLLLLEQWGGTTGVAAAVGADLLQGLPDERRHDSAVSTSSEDEFGSTTEEEADAEEYSAAMVTACTPPLLSSAAAAPPVQHHQEQAPSFAGPSVTDRVTASSAAPPVHPTAAAAWPGEHPPPRRPRRRLHKRQQQEPFSPVAKVRGVGEEGGPEGGELAEAGAEAEEEKGEVVLEQRRLYGVNRLPRRPLSSFFSLCMEAASDATLRVLMFCGLMSLVLALLFSKEPETEVIEGLAIWVAVLVVVLVTAGNDWMKEQQFALLSAVKEDKKCSVIRSGEAKQLSVFDLVVGDLLQLEAGDEIPADALLVQGRDVKVDESSLTGESDPITKEPFLVCMQEATASQRQQQSHEAPLLLPPRKKRTQHDDRQQQQLREEEGESVAASTAAESVAVPVGSPSHLTVLHEATHASTPPCSSTSHSSVPGHFGTPTSAEPSSNPCPPEFAGVGGGVLAPPSPDASCSLAAALLPVSFSSSSSVAAAAPALPSPPGSPTLLARHHAVPSPVLLSGTTLSTGSCTALVIAVGPYSQVGQTFQKLAFDPEPTPLQMKLNALAEDIGNFGLAAAIAAFVVLLVEFWLLFWMQPPQTRAQMHAVDILHEHVEFFVTDITILVVAVPEGLPLAVTISLAYSISQMLRDQNYVRRLAACEIMGGANEICSDKTGTLTKNQMAVTVFWGGACPGPRRKEEKTPLLLDVPASAAAGEEQEEQEPHAVGSSGEGSVTPTSKEAERGSIGDVSSREDRSSKVEERSAAGFSKEYTEPLLEAEPTARTTPRSTDAATTGRTATAVPAPAEGRESTTSKTTRRYAAWMEGERDRQQQRKWLLLAEAIAVNSTAFLEKEADEDLVTIGAAGEPDETGPAQPARVRYKHVGSPTECALLAFSTFQCRYNYASLRRQILGEEDRYLVERREFTSDRKMMTSIIRLSPEAVRLEQRFVPQQHQQLHGSREQGTPEAGGRGQQQHSGEVAIEGAVRVFVKGAAERVLRQCSRVLVSDNEEYVLTPALVSTIEEEVINCMAARALRTICIAYKDIPPDAGATPATSPQQQHDQLSSTLPTTNSTAAPGATPPAPNPVASASAGIAALDASGFDIFERELVCLGIAGIEDPVREEVPGAVLQCQAAGIRVRMVTGDNLLTAAAIATQCNIYHEATGGLAMLGSDFMRYIGGVVCQRCGTAVCNCATDAKTAEEEGKPLRVDVIKNLGAFRGIWQRLEVLARSQPTDKYALVCALQQLHRVVAVTGDGTNDAPALRKADVGFAMGLSGKEVAKQAADIVMLDDNFTCIVKAVRWGRSVYDNIRRFLQFQLTVNVVAVLLTVTCVAVEREAPLSAVQMLWINLIMDSFASLALATEPPTDALLRRKPHGRDSYLVSRVMLASILSAACYQLVVILVLIFYGEKLLPETSWKFVSQQQRLKLHFCEFSDGVPEHCVGHYMVSGRRYKLFSTEEDYKTEWLREFGPSRHKTFVFNTFVFMQVFNMLAARDVDDEGPSSSLLQLGTAMLRNKLGLSVWLFILLAQILMTELGGRVLGCHFDLSEYVQFENLICSDLNIVYVLPLASAIPRNQCSQADEKLDLTMLKMTKNRKRR
ncbi:UNVERIFIED_CONTAM: hypothetical protein H355_006193 [Colinus virginianus]|nr:hypothetical protein H355_006193 [Colinus virginianus]